MMLVSVSNVENFYKCEHVYLFQIICNFEAGLTLNL